MVKEEIEEDKIAIPEAKLVKYQYMFDYYDAKEHIIKYVKTGQKRNLEKANNSILSLWLQLKPEFKQKELKGKVYEDVLKLDYFLENRNKMPSYKLIISFYRILQFKLKKMRVLDITFPEADIGKDFQRSW